MSRVFHMGLWDPTKSVDENIQDRQLAALRAKLDKASMERNAGRPEEPRPARQNWVTRPRSSEVRTVDPKDVIERLNARPRSVPYADLFEYGRPDRWIDLETDDDEDDAVEKPSRKVALEAPQTGAPYYFAYGSNLNERQMDYRCPGATPSLKHTLKGYKLVFRGVADIVKTDNPEDFVPGILWKIIPAHERSLDRFEGVHGGRYRKETFHFWTKSKHKREALVYKMTGEAIKPPTNEYLIKIASGYARFKLDTAKLSEALNHSVKHKGEML